MKVPPEQMNALSLDRDYYDESNHPLAPREQMNSLFWLGALASKVHGAAP